MKYNIIKVPIEWYFVLKSFLNVNIILVVYNYEDTGELLVV